MIQMYEYKVKMIRVIDGDTFVCDIDLGFEVILKNKHIRIAHINAPENNTDAGKAATKYLGYMLMPNVDQHVSYSPEIVLNIMNHKNDKYGRILAEVKVNGRMMHHVMVEDGHAVPYEGKG